MILAKFIGITIAGTFIGIVIVTFFTPLVPLTIPYIIFLTVIAAIIAAGICWLDAG